MHMTQTNAHYVQQNVIGYPGLPSAELWSPNTDLSKVSFAVQPRGIRTEEQLREFVERHFAEIFRRTLPVVRYSEERAREITQELYPRLLTMLMANPEGFREPWAVIRVVTRNLAIDGYRKAASYHENLRGLWKGTRAQVSENYVEEDEDKKQLSTLVSKAVSTLEDRQFHVITGIFLGGILAKNIAQELELSESRVADIKRDALDRMRALLQDRIEREGVTGWTLRSLPARAKRIVSVIE
jgi:RNA polymerase sigma factor (sigma-70 family)